MLKRPVVRFLIISGLCIFIIYEVFKSLKRFSAEAMKNDLPPSFTLSNDDLKFYSADYRIQIKPVVIFNSKVRYPVEVLKVENKLVYRFSFDIQAGFNFQDNVHLSPGNVTDLNSKTYLLLSKDEYNIKVLQSPMKNIDSVFLLLNQGKAKLYFKSDSLLGYKIDAGSFSVKFNKDAADYIYCANGYGDISMLTPLDIVLWKKNKKLYIFIKKPESNLYNDFSLIEMLNLRDN